MKMNKIIFDSNIHNWKRYQSEFKYLIWCKENLLFLIETEDNIKFGGFISSKIDKYHPIPISDENAFVFTFKDNKPMKFNIKKDRKDRAFKLFEKSDDRLFLIGNGDIRIYKQNVLSSINQDIYSSFDYQGIENALIGKTGYGCFSPKRFLVIQMK